MINRVIRTAAVSLFALGGLVALAPASMAQETTTTVAVAAESVAPVADTAAAVDPAATPAVEPAAAPEGGVAAGGGFLSNDSNNTMPVVLGVGALVAGAGFVVSRRRKA